MYLKTLKITRSNDLDIVASGSIDYPRCNTIEKYNMLFQGSHQFLDTTNYDTHPSTVLSDATINWA